ncbi:GntR family transcriptional regulator [Oceanobacillus damuensis]|uniref:GntR family transcriptional regulator n=1 Tax=Oceanobacillus damuensis TaxID=937928 RepID=UPI00082D23D2|nr:GntR family transcriptional regulator [Oceanobacillus damuensis]
MKPIAKRKTTKEMVYEQLKRAILNGDINHTEILTETYLANSLNTSRTPIREAVADLIKEGLLIHIQRKGFCVRKIEDHEMEQILYLRSSIEMKGVTLLAKTVSSDEIEILNSIISGQQDAIKNQDRIKYIELDQIFHRQILKFSNQNLLEGILQELYNLSLLIGHAAIMKEGRMEEVIQEHKNIVKALEKKNEYNAAELMKEHLLITGASVRKGKN